jgi:hypothetical protein
MVADRKLIGQILIEMGLVTESQIREALAIQWQRYDRIGNILVKLGYVTEEEVPLALGAQAGRQPLPSLGEAKVARRREPLRVKPFVGVLTGFPELLPDLKKILAWRLGEIDIESDLLSFDFTDYYREEMGANLKRTFYSFRRLVSPEVLADLKVWTNDIERAFVRRTPGFGRGVPFASPLLPQVETSVTRPVNLDPGYVSLGKTVLASTKDYSHRIYLRDGIYAEVTLTFTKGKFESWPWTFPDYRQESYMSFFNSMRAALKAAGDVK